MLNAPIPKAIGLAPVTDPSLNRYQRFGIELEYEHVFDRVNTRGLPWEAVRDGSLRDGGIELVSRPLKFRDVGPALTTIMGNAARTGAIASPRCGLHLHINMRPYSVGNVLSLSAVYGLAEPAIFAKFAEGRDLSPFCVPQHANTMLTASIANDVQMARQEQPRRYLMGMLGSNKYSALNYSSLGRFGTVEARQLHGTLDPQEAREWVVFWKRLVDFSLGYEDPVHVVDDYEANGREWLHEALFGEQVEVDLMDQEDAEVSCILMAGADAEDVGGMGVPPEDDFFEEDELLEEDEW